MIKEPTVLVLGAGASNPYGYPTGYELIQNILDNVTSTQSLSEYAEFGIGEGAVKAFRDCLDEACAPSIDAVLETRREFTDIGKIAIARELIRAEVGSRKLGEGWYYHLFNCMFDGFETFGDNKISIVTFNYDRSIDHLLFSALMARSGKNAVECAEKLSQIAILHLHGQIDYLPWQSVRSNRPYKTPATSASMLQAASSGIKIIHEVSDFGEGTDFEKARNVLKDAKNVLCLGFGYHKTNVERIGLPNLDTAGMRMRWGTCYQMAPVQTQNIQQKILNDKIDLHASYATGEIMTFINFNVIFE